MKKIFKTFTLSMLLVAYLFSYGFVNNEKVFATSSEEKNYTISDDFDISIQSDKSSYKTSDIAKISVVAKNTSDEEYKNVSIFGILPEEITAVDSSKMADTIDCVKPGEEIKLSFDVKLITSEESQEESEVSQESSTVEESEVSREFSNIESSQTSDITQSSLESVQNFHTGDSNALIYVLSLIFITLLVMVILLKTDKRKKSSILSLFFCFIVVMSTFGSGFNVLAIEENEVSDNYMFSSCVINFENISYYIEVKIEYSFGDKGNDLISEPMMSEYIDELFNSSDNSDELDISDQDLAATSVKVDYETKNGTGDVHIQDISQFSYMSRIPGAVSKPIDISLINDELISSTITFSYDDDALGDIDEKNLGIAWYDEENNEIIILDNVTVDTEKNTVSVKTTHFSKYILVNLSEWYEKWAIEQLVVRNDEGTKTPYYNIIFAIDNSYSMSSYNRMNICKAATKEFIRSLNGKDMISIMSFSNYDHVYVKNALVDGSDSIDSLIITDPKSRFDTIIDSIYPDDMTNYEAGLNRALSLVLEAEEKQNDNDPTNPFNTGDIHRQNLIIFISDGDPTTKYSSKTLEQLKFLATNANCKMISLGIGNNIREEYLQEMAEAGQGKCFFVENSSEIPEVYEQINAMFIGSTKDSDEDGIPDIVETTGMRTQYGYFITTDPNNKNTDGDGKNDMEEMGNFIYKPDGQSYFSIVSDPTIPTFYSSKSKAKLSFAQMQIQDINKNKLENMTYKELSNIFKKLQISYGVTGIRHEIAKDFLSEVIYAKPDVTATVNAILGQSCNNPADVRKITFVDTNSIFDEIQSFTNIVNFDCANSNAAVCTTLHSMRVEIKNNNGEILGDDYKEISFDATKEWQKIINKKLSKLNAKVNKEQKDISKNTKSIINDVHNSFDKAKQKDKTEIINAVESYFGIDASLPTDAKKAFLDLYYTNLEKMIADTSHTYSLNNVNTSADLVNTISKNIGSEDGKITFKTSSKKEYIYEYKVVTSIWGNSFTTGQIVDKTSNRRYTLGFVQKNSSNIDVQIKHLKDFAQTKIDEVWDELTEDILSIGDMDSVSELFSKLMNNQAMIDILENFDSTHNLKNRMISTSKCLPKLSKIIDKLDRLNKLETITEKDYDKFIEEVGKVNKMIDNYDELRPSFF